MGKLVKNHLARLITMTAAIIHIAASTESFFWPKFFFDFLTKNFDVAVKPIPILQIINLSIAVITLAYEWPLNFLAGSRIHESILVRLFWLPLASLGAALLYQSTDPALYYLVATMMYFWAYTEGEMICAVPWSLPKKGDRQRGASNV